MKILIGMETSGMLRRAFAARGWYAVSVDLLPCEDCPTGPLQQHWMGDVRDWLQRDWDMFIFHPDCTYLASSGLHWNKRVPGRAVKTEEAVQFVKELWRTSAHIPRRCMENPVGRLSTAFRKPDQIIQPWQFGANASKATCLWLDGLPRLKSTRRVPGRIVGYRPNGQPIERWANQTDSGQNRLGPSENRWRERARTYAGIADAMAEQWGHLE